MVWNLLTLIVAYLIACAGAYALHEAAHYVVHARYAETVSLTIAWPAPSVTATYGLDGSPTVARLGSVAPTVVFAPLVGLGIYLYMTFYPIPTLSPTVWTMVAVPLLILVYPTADDRHGYWYGLQ
ncbi:hypothetical protein [Haloglomus litoreum]|uniref:hypothetical protein n=1 Tax=Haloglomus litoreum TaxID=3034026 RepID=UPI0023E80874|nr:hypothetical protein [Haloglomus sp. DT116]